MNIEYNEFKAEINRKRKAGGWYQFVGLVEGKQVRLKGYKTWLQIYSVDGISYGNPMDQKVGEFNEALYAPFKHVC